MWISNEKVEYREGLGSEDNLFRAAQEGSVRRVEDERIKYEPRPVAHLPPPGIGEWSPRPQVYNNFTIALLPQMASPCQPIVAGHFMGPFFPSQPHSRSWDRAYGPDQFQHVSFDGISA